MPEKSKRDIARENLKIELNNKIIISLDGGGIRGIFTLQLLKKLEEIAGSPIYEWADMIAGTSTGTIIGGFITKKKSAIEIEALYMDLVSQVFTEKNCLSNRYLNPPRYDKKNYRKILKTKFGDDTLRSLNKHSGLDMLFTAKDLVAAEETFFTCFKIGERTIGTYQNVLMRAVMEATMSAPTYFTPFERFVDGGTTTFNNPVMAAVLEAIRYNGRGKYKANELTIFSFGSGELFRFVDLKHAENPIGIIDVKFWLDYVLDEASKDASEMQVDMLRSGIIPGIDFRRYQMSLDKGSLEKIFPDLPTESLPCAVQDWINASKNEELHGIDMSDVTKMKLMKILGNAVVEFICPSTEANMPMDKRKKNWFQKDFIDKVTERGKLITARGEINANKSHLSNFDWIDQRNT